MVYVLISVFLGLSSWVVPFLKCKDNNKKTILSFTLCLFSIFIQILMMKNYGDEWTLIVDALGALTFVVPLLIMGTIIANVLGNRKVNHNF